MSHEVPVPYHSHTEWWGENETRADELWENLDISPLTVALTDDWAVEHGLDISEARFPWDDDKGVYYLKAFHGLHCLVCLSILRAVEDPLLTSQQKIMRRAFVDLQRGNPEIINGHHIHHCLDALRQDIMCTGDDTPMPTVLEKDKIGDNQVRMCRSFDKLVGWSQALERNACYRRLTDYRWVHHKLERFAFCPKDSPSYAVQTAYFEKWGHKDPFVE